MKFTSFNKLIAAAMGGALTLSAASTAYAASPSGTSLIPETRTAGEAVIYSTDFEDGDVSYFSKRGDTDTSVIAVAEDETAPSGTKVMSVTGRSKGWNGPSFDASKNLEPNVKYQISVKVKAQWYNNINVSLQHTQSGASSPSYTNLTSGVSQGDWIELTTSFSFPETDTDVSVYIEANDAVDLFVDDFCIQEAPNSLDLTIPSLKDVYSDMFKIGTAVTASELAPGTTKQLILKHFNSITAGNELKPDAILDQAACLAMAEDGNDTDPQVSLASARSILDFARDNNIPVRGHVLVWHQQTPTWFFKENYDPDGEWVSEEKMLKRLENYIKNVFTAVKDEYPDVDFYAWDVVNECWLDDGSARKPGTQEEGSANSPWVKIFGDNISFIKPAFEYAKKYAPEGTKLYYNDFNEYMPQKTDAIVKMVEEINSDGHYIDGIGLQSHLNATNNGGSDPFPSVSVYKKALEKFCATGLDIQITELDATVDNEKFDLQAQYYSDIMDAIVEYKDYISAVVFWGTTDDQSWRASKNPLLFNEDYSAKPAYDAIIDGLEIPETTTTTAGETTTTTTTTAAEEETTTTTAEVTVPDEETTTTAAGSAAVCGDANEDGEIKLNDAVLIMQAISNPNKFGIDGTDELHITETGWANADCNNPGDGVTGKDALAIQKLTLKLIDSLPETE